MAYDKSYIRAEELESFKEFLTKANIGWAVPKAMFQALLVYYAGQTMVITTNAREVLASPAELRPLIDLFHEAQGEITDTQRLEFILLGGRQVLTEIHGYNSAGESHFQVYVVKGTFHDTVYPKVHHTCRMLSDKDSLPLIRQAIDLAIRQEQSNA